MLLRDIIGQSNICDILECLLVTICFSTMGYTHTSTPFQFYIFVFQRRHTTGSKIILETRIQMRFSKKIFETCWAVSSSIFTLKAHDFLRSGRGRYWHIHSVGTTFVGNSKSIYVHQIEILFGLLSWNQVVCFAEWI